MTPDQIALVQTSFGRLATQAGAVAPPQPAAA